MLRFRKDLPSFCCWQKWSIRAHLQLREDLLQLEIQLSMRHEEEQ